MKEVLILTGACGVGKTTLARQWAERKNGAVIECDYFTEWIYDSNFPHWTPEEERFVANLTAVVAREYLNFGMSVVIENVWSPQGIEWLLEGLRDQTQVKIKVVWLYCERSENHRRDEQRREKDQMKDRVDIVNEELIGYDWPTYLHKVDTTKLTVPQTMDLIDDLGCL